MTPAWFPINDVQTSGDEMGMRKASIQNRRGTAAAAPATVCGERPVTSATGQPGRPTERIDPQARRPAMRDENPIPSGVTGKGDKT